MVQLIRQTKITLVEERTLDITQNLLDRLNTYIQYQIKEDFKPLTMNELLFMLNDIHEGWFYVMDGFRWNEDYTYKIMNIPTNLKLLIQDFINKELLTCTNVQYNKTDEDWIYDRLHEEKEED